MSRQDQIVDDEEPETCPLCIEELDLSDRRFRPCPCGFQICQFCYNHVKTQMNSLCPACRRPYEDKNIKFEAPSAEEVAKYKESKAQQDKKKAAARRQEAASRQADNLSRKHLAGIRVRRHNLVYVTGLRLNTSDPLLSEKLRGAQFFGQYGKIDKIVVNKPKDSRSVQPVGVYITYFEKDAAALCIEMVNGTQNAGGTIRADYGTTKYCSAFLRGETCSNKNCTFLHEVGDDNESFTREGLSSLNAVSSQFHGQTSSPHQSNLPLQPSPSHQNQRQPSPQPSSQPQSSLSTGPQTIPPDVSESAPDEGSPVESSDGSALPSTASWAKEPPSRRASQAQSLTSASPAISTSNPMPPVTEAPTREQDLRQPSAVDEAARAVEEQLDSTINRSKSPRLIDPDILRLTEALTRETSLFSFDDSSVSPQELELINNMPPLFDPYGGLRRMAARQRAAEPESDRVRREKDDQVASQALSAMDAEDNLASGSLQLGGEPELRQDLDTQQQHRQQQQRTVQAPTHDALRSPQFGLEHALSPTTSQPPSLSGRSPMPQQQQQQQFLLQQFKSTSPNPLGPNQRAQPDQFQQPAGVAHSRQTSRFSFANDSASATTSIKPVTNPKLMNQQSSMMPPNHGPNQFSSSQQQGQGNQFFSSGVQGPPPGLKATGTPPVSGGGMFGQGHGFATAGLGYGINSTSRNSNDDMMRELLRTRGSSAGSGQTPDGGRLDLADPSILQARMHQSGAMGQGQYGAQGQGQDPNTTDTNVTYKPRFGQDPFRGFESAQLPGVPEDELHEIQNSSQELFSKGVSHTHNESTLMPGLGLLPNPSPSSGIYGNESREVRRSRLQIPEVLTQQSASVAKERVSPRMSEEAFPALPKPTTVKATVEAKPKTSRPTVEEQSRQKGKQAPRKNEAQQSTIPDSVPGSPGTELQRRQNQPHDEVDHRSGTEQTPTTPSASSKPATPVHVQQERSVTPWSSRPATPTQSDTASRRANPPRTIRVLPTEKIDTPSPPTESSTPSKTSISAQRLSEGTAAPTSNVPSRQPSLSSMHRSGTPGSERFADNVSITSGSISRASSPPQAFHSEASASTKQKSRNQLKKEKNEKPRTLVEDKKETASTSEAVMQEPVIGRKKKTRKPATAVPSSVTRQDPVEPASATSETKPKQSSQEPDETHDNIQPVASSETALEEPEQVQDSGPAPVESSLPTEIISSAIANGDIDPSRRSFFQGPTSMTGIRHDFAMDNNDGLQSLQVPLSASELEALENGKSVHRGAENSNSSDRLLVTPGRRFLFGLTKDMEDRFLEVEQRVAELPAHLKYIHKRTDATQNLTSADEMLKDLYSLLTRPPTTIDAVKANLQAGSRSSKGGFLDADATAGFGTTSSPAYGDDALQYMNKFILPPIPDRGGAASYPSMWDSALGRGSFGLSTSAEGLNSITGAEEDLTPPATGREHLFDREHAAVGNNANAIKQAWLDAVDELDQRGGIPFTTKTAGRNGTGAAALELDAMEKVIQVLKRENDTLDKKMLSLMKRNRKLADVKFISTETVPSSA